MGNEEEDIEKMNYAVVNSDEISTVEKLEKYTGEIRWSYLKPHFEAGSLIWVSPELILTEVGHAVTEDESNRVESWKREGLILIPSEPHAGIGKALTPLSGRWWFPPSCSYSRSRKSNLTKLDL